MDGLDDFLPVVRDWFAERVGTPTAVQVRAWASIRAGGNVLLAAPTGSGKTLAAFLVAIDALLRETELADTCRVLYVSPLRALSNDVQKNLLGPLAELAQRDALLPRLRVEVRSGDTPAAARARMVRKPPHLLVTTPESLGILLCSASGRGLLAGVRTLIIDEIHAMAASKRGAHLALAVERLEGLRQRRDGTAAPLQRIALSATQRPLERIAEVLAGVAAAEQPRPVTIIDEGHLRRLDVGVEIPSSPLEAIASLDVWTEMHGRLMELILAHRTTLIFVPTRSMAERLSLRLIDRCNDAELPGETLIACHHGSLSKERRLDAEQRLKAGSLRALVATATLELGIDIGDVDLVIQIGSSRTIATFLQRAGRAGHGIGRLPKARIVCLTAAELIEATALLRAVRAGELDALVLPTAPLDVLAQHLIAAATEEPHWAADDLYRLLTTVWTYRALPRSTFDSLVELHSQGRFALLHRDPATGLIRATKRAKLVVVTCGGAIPDAAVMQVREDPGDLLVGTVDEDFAVESSPGDIFQLGNTSWKILRVDGRAGVVRVENAQGAPPSIPFWFGEAPGRSPELSLAVGRLRAEAESRLAEDESWLRASSEHGVGGDLHPEAARVAWALLRSAQRALGALPTDQRIVAERFFDELGCQHLVIHACFGTRINRAWGLALRKRFCTGFGFELEAAATDEGLILSLGPTTSFALEDVFRYLSPATLRATLIQACVTGGQFETRWRWAAATALLVERARGGQRTPPHLLRMRANDALVGAFPGALACPDNLPPGDLPVPEDHPIVAQTVTDCLTDLLDHPGLCSVLERVRSGALALHAVDVAEPSPLAQAILAARPYAFLDDVEFGNRRIRAVPPATGTSAPVDGLDPAVVQQVTQAAWPDPANAEELHEVLAWIGHVTEGEAAASRWGDWLGQLAAAGRAERADDRWYARGISRDDVDQWRGRLEVMGAVPFTVAGEDDLPLLTLEREGVAMRTRVAGSGVWIHRRLFQRSLSLMRQGEQERRRTWFAPVPISRFVRFLASWQGVAPWPGEASAAPAASRRDEGQRVPRWSPPRLAPAIAEAQAIVAAIAATAPVERAVLPQRVGPAGTAHTIRQLAALELPAGGWRGVLQRRVADFTGDHLDQLVLGGEVVWGRLWASPAAEADHAPSALRATPIAFVLREDLERWVALAGPAGEAALSGPAREVLAVLQQDGALFLHELFKRVRQVPATIEGALSELVAAGLITADSMAALRWLLLAPDRRKAARPPAGRWSLQRPAVAARPVPTARLSAADRTGVALQPGAPQSGDSPVDPDTALLVARTLLARTGVVLRRTWERERIHCPWREVLRALRTLELQGEVVGGRFVAGCTGEQFATTEAAKRLRQVADAPADEPPYAIAADDPLNHTGSLVPGERTRPLANLRVTLG
jgi:ATP-dependent Lhr-like helicase